MVQRAVSNKALGDTAMSKSKTKKSKGKNIDTHFYLPEKLYARLKQEAERNCRSVSSQARFIIMQAVGGLDD